MKLLFSNDWLRRKLITDPDEDPEAGFPLMSQDEKELTMSVRCKVQVIRVGIPYHYPNLELMPVHADIEGSENSKFFNATPSGEIKLGVQNETALAQFKPGDYFYVDFTPAPKQ